MQNTAGGCKNPLRTKTARGNEWSLSIATKGTAAGTFSAHYAVVFSMCCRKLTVLPIAAVIIITFSDPIDFNSSYDQDTYGQTVPGRLGREDINLQDGSLSKVHMKLLV